MLDHHPIMSNNWREEDLVSLVPPTKILRQDYTPQGDNDSEICYDDPIVTSGSLTLLKLFHSFANTPPFLLNAESKL